MANKTTKKVEKTKNKRSKMEKEELKNFIFEKLSFGYSQKEISDLTGYSVQHICAMNKEIEDEFLLQIIDKDRNKLISKEIRRLEGITKKLYKELEKETNGNRMVGIHQQILKTIEFSTKLRGLLVEKVENKVSVDELLTKEEQDKFNDLFE